MKRLLQAPNLVLATLWADQLVGAGIAAPVSKSIASGRRTTHLAGITRSSL